MDPWSASALLRYRFRAVGQTRGHADRGASGRDILLDQRTGADFSKVADHDVAENRGPRAEQNAAADPGGPVRQRGLSANGDVLQDGGVVADHGERRHSCVQAGREGDAESQRAPGLAGLATLDGHGA